MVYLVNISDYGLKNSIRYSFLRSTCAHFFIQCWLSSPELNIVLLLLVCVKMTETVWCFKSGPKWLLMK